MHNEFNSKEGSRLLKLARQSILDAFEKKETEQKSSDDQTEKSGQVKRGTFVTLHKKGQLRGCIGNIEACKSVQEGIIDNARSAAFNDSRFSPLTLKEFAETQIEISILTEPEVLEYTDGKDLISKLRPGIDGVTIKKRYQGATFLPQVWKQLRDPDLFLSHLCMKAGFPAKEWETGSLDVSIYQVQSFDEDPSVSED